MNRRVTGARILRVAAAVVAVATGEGIKQTFREMGADCIVEGGQSMNPSSEDFIRAFDTCHAENIIVLPNNGNVILAAQQAAKLYSGANVYVLESKTIGEGHAALSMMNPNPENIEEIVAEMQDAMTYSLTACVSKCVRDFEAEHVQTKNGDYIGFCGKEILSDAPDRVGAACGLLDSLNLSDYAVCILLEGMRADNNETQLILEHLKTVHRNIEVYDMVGNQEIFDYIMLIE